MNINIENLSNLSDDMLEMISSAIRNEKSKRMVSNIEAGKYPPLNTEEILFIHNHNKTEAVKSYRARNDVDLTTSIAIVNHFKEGWEKGKARGKDE